MRARSVTLPLERVTQFNKYFASAIEVRDAGLLGSQGIIVGFLLHTLPSGLHRIRHYGLLANGNRKASLAAARELLGQGPPSQGTADDANVDHNEPRFVCRHCGSALIVVETLARSPRIRAPPAS